jgi:hypothetical protein
MLSPSLLASTLAFAALLALGCTYNNSNDPTTQPTTRPGDAALRDPFGKWSNVNPNISGGGINNLDRDALKHDTDSFFLK